MNSSAVDTIMSDMEPLPARDWVETTQPNAATVVQ